MKPNKVRMPLIEMAIRSKVCFMDSDFASTWESEWEAVCAIWEKSLGFRSWSQNPRQSVCA